MTITRPVALLFTFAFPAIAAPPLPTEQSLPELIVSATREPSSVFEAPYAASLLESSELQDRGVRSLPDALRYEPGVMIQKTSAGQGSPFVRGFTGFRTLALVDGVRLNNSTFREGPNQYWNTIDAYGLGRIELTRGQGSVLYGSDAIGGTMNAVPKGAPYFPGTAAQGKNAAIPAATASGGQLYSRYASGEDAILGRVEGWMSEDQKYGIFLGFTAKDFGDLRAADLGRLPKTGYEEWDMDARAEFWVEPDLKFTLAHQQVHQDDVWRTHRTIYGVPWEGTTVGNDKVHSFDQDRVLTYARLEGTPGGAVDSWSFTLSHHKQSEDRERVRSNNRRDLEGFDVDTLGADLKFTSKAGSSTFTYGLDYYHDNVNSYHHDYNAAGNYTGSAIQGPVGDDGEYHLFGAYAQDVIAFDEQTDLTLGARYTYAKADIGRVADPKVTGNVISIKDDWHNLTGSIRLGHDLDEAGTLRLYGGISQGFRAPNLSDLSRLDTARSGELETAAPGLDPEQYISYELGLKTQTERFRGEAAVFYFDITDMIVRAPTGNTVNGLTEVTKRNAGDGWLYGIELSGEYDLDENWTAFASFAWQDGEVDGYPTAAPVPVEEPISRLLPATGTAGIRYTSTDRKWWVEASVLAADKADNLSSGDKADTQRIPPGGTPGYVIANLRAGWNVTDDFTVTAALENLTDEDYRIHGSGQNEPGLNAIVTAGLKF